MSTLSPPPESVIWHELECGRYAADLPLWRALAEAEPGPVLDVGAGTGRVALDLVRHGHRVIALDHDPALLEALLARARDLPVTPLAADARDFALPEPAGLVLVPMQTLQLLADAEERRAFLRAARAALRPGGLLAAALADALEGFGSGVDELPLPDRGVRDGIHYASQPVAVRDEGDRVAIERIRTTLAADGARTAAGDTVRLARLTADDLAREAAPLGFVAEAPRRIEATDEHVGSEVAMLRG